VARIITESKNKGKTLLLITHDLEFAANTADVMAVLYLGQIMEKLPATDLLFNPLHPYTLALGRSYPAMDTARDLGGIRGDAFYRIVHQHGHEDLTRYGHTHIQVPQSVHQDGHPSPIGCLFQERCTQAVEDCGKEAVSLQEIDNHEVRCLRRGIVDRIELKGVAKTYGEVTALQPLDLTVKAGELLALVGETGSGKTTLAMVAAGVIKPDQGVRRLDGRDMDRWMKADAKSLAGRIGVVYQNPAESISHRFSVYEAVAEPLKIHGIRENKEAQKASVKAVLANVRLSTDKAFLNRYSHELNMGALQRVCMARALILGPQVLVADEPTSALDPSVQAKVLKLLLELQIERGLTMLFVSHDLGLARKISDRIGVMLKGRFAELGPASLILAKPAHPYTRMLIDSVGGHWRENDGETSGDIPLSGCPFTPRCPGRKMICHVENPHLRLIDRRYVACHFPYNFMPPFS
jgi:peptide/nickel transport system ATP-binding protein